MKHTNRTSATASADLPSSVRHAERPVLHRGRPRVHVPLGKSHRLAPNRRGNSSAAQQPRTGEAAEEAHQGPRRRRRGRPPWRPWWTTRPEGVGANRVRRVRCNDPLRRRDGRPHPTHKVATVPRRPCTPHTAPQTAARVGTAKIASSRQRPAAWLTSQDQPSRSRHETVPRT